MTPNESSFICCSCWPAAKICLSFFCSQICNPILFIMRTTLELQLSRHFHTCLPAYIQLITFHAAPYLYIPSSVVVVCRVTIFSRMKPRMFWIVLQLYLNGSWCLVHETECWASQTAEQYEPEIAHPTCNLQEEVLTSTSRIKKSKVNYLSAKPLSFNIYSKGQLCEKLYWSKKKTCTHQIVSFLHAYTEKVLCLAWAGLFLRFKDHILSCCIFIQCW